MEMKGYYEPYPAERPSHPWTAHIHDDGRRRLSVVRPILVVLALILIFCAVMSSAHGAGKRRGGTFRASRGSSVTNNSATRNVKMPGYSWAAINHALSGSCGCGMCQGIRNWYAQNGNVTSSTSVSRQVSQARSQSSGPVRTSQTVSETQRQPDLRPYYIENERRVYLTDKQIRDWGIGSTPETRSSKVEVSTSSEQTEAKEHSTPLEVRYKMLAMMKLNGPMDFSDFDPDVHDTECDLGSGREAKIIRDAARLYGVRAVGIEIDLEDVLHSRKLIQKDVEAGLLSPGQVRVIHGDALEVDLRAIRVADDEVWEATCCTAFLYPDLLAKLSDKLKTVDRFALPYHPLPGDTTGLTETQQGNVFFYSIRGIAARSVPVGTFKFVPYGERRESIVSQGQKNRGLIVYTATANGERWCSNCNRLVDNELPKLDVPIWKTYRKDELKKHGIERIPVIRIVDILPDGKLRPVMDDGKERRINGFATADEIRAKLK